MAVARRAKLRPAQVAVPLTLAALLVASGLYAASRFGPESGTAGPTPSVGATESTAAPAGASTASSPTGSPTKPSPSRSPSATRTADQAADRALAACRAKVKSADAVIAQAKVGTAHWIDHIQTETDAQRGKISDTQKKARFKTTRLLGPADQTRYRDATTAYAKLTGSCAAVSGAPKATAAALARCDQRRKAQQPLMKAGAATMADWRTHLADMQRSRNYHVPDAQAVWLKTYRAAPANINAYTTAAADFKAPSC